LSCKWLKKNAFVVLRAGVCRSYAGDGYFIFRAIHSSYRAWGIAGAAIPCLYIKMRGGATVAAATALG